MRLEAGESVLAFEFRRDHMTVKWLRRFMGGGFQVSAPSMRAAAEIVHHWRMEESDPDRLKGSSCTATLDVAAGTLTFEHRGWLQSKAQKALSPVVVPLGEIASVEYKWGRMSGWFRIVRRGQDPWPDNVATDPHGLNCGVDPTPFARRVRAAAFPGEPLALEEDEVKQPECDVVEAKAAPSLGAQIAKTVASGLIEVVIRYPSS